MWRPVFFVSCFCFGKFCRHYASTFVCVYMLLYLCMYSLHIIAQSGPGYVIHSMLLVLVASGGIDESVDITRNSKETRGDELLLRLLRSPPVPCVTSCLPLLSTFWPWWASAVYADAYRYVYMYVRMYARRHQKRVSPIQRVVFKPLV